MGKAGKKGLDIRVSYELTLSFKAGGLISPSDTGQLVKAAEFAGWRVSGSQLGEPDGLQC